MKAEGHGRILETVKRYQAAIEYLRSHTATGGGMALAGHPDIEIYLWPKTPGLACPFVFGGWHRSCIERCYFFLA